MRDGILMEIQETVERYAEIISKIAFVDVEVVDRRLFRVAGTGMFKAHVNEDMSSAGYTYSRVLETGERQIIYEPGKDPVCDQCPQKGVCGEEIEIAMPVRLGEEIIGVIGLVGNSKSRKRMILRNEKLYLDLIEQISDFIAGKAAEVEDSKDRMALLGAIDHAINHMDQGVLLMGNDGTVAIANDYARRRLKEEDPVGKKAVIVPTGDTMNHRKEYRLSMGKRELSVLGEVYRVPGFTNQYSSVLLFEDTRDVQKRYYEMTATVRTVKVDNIVGSSPATMRMKEDIARIAGSTSTVLITGESGTGKEMVATAIWDLSGRKKNRFVAINCAAIPEALLESELFGYVKGAFTGADPNGRMGKFELADKGTIFLDEIGDMPLYLQAKLLRVLQERTIIRIGSNQVIPIDVRVISATNKDLKEMIREKKFREDLYYRLNVIPLKIPPLRERKEDIEELTDYFAGRYAGLLGKTVRHITESVRRALAACPWRGNVRELENVVEFMVNMMGEDGVLDERTLPRDFWDDAEEEQIRRAELQPEDGEMIVPLKELERLEIEKALRICGSTTDGKKEAAARLGIGVATLYRKLEQYSQNEK
ncbi:MAG TPA: sigma 54-interacting transcriptional regulator [Candidatus Lachnoclostridium stercoripullorum]|uniref:Sigma 54-interacting transcriptional regulator n=1 Tax=Candidatus Lachnoclostridium stercoripullorum TaxID=2838635 RepID=A0A9D2AX79_9FIRM|nr:sigma 54-interacting transcriptional regulator [Candidatus Lachnoclostridium stercoripullorum]